MAEPTVDPSENHREDPPAAPYAAAHYRDPSLRYTAHFLAIIVAVAMIRLPFGSWGSSELPILHMGGLQYAAVVACFFAAVHIIRHSANIDFYQRVEQVIYRWTAHSLAMVYLAVELEVIGEGAITIRWGAYALIILAAGLIQQQDDWKYAGMVMILVTVAKLLIRDLQNLELMWRILLLCGFGLALLVVSRPTTRRKTP